MNQEEAIKNIECDIEKACLLSCLALSMTRKHIWEFAYESVDAFIKYFDIELPDDYKPLKLNLLSNHEIINLVNFLTREALITIMCRMNDYDCLSDLDYRGFMKEILLIYKAF
jgi:hypothetical protein